MLLQEVEIAATAKESKAKLQRIRPCFFYCDFIFVSAATQPTSPPTMAQQIAPAGNSPNQPELLLPNISIFFCSVELLISPLWAYILIINAALDYLGTQCMKQISSLKHQLACHLLVRLNFRALPTLESVHVEGKEGIGLTLTSCITVGYARVTTVLPCIASIQDRTRRYRSTWAHRIPLRCTAPFS